MVRAIQMRFYGHEVAAGATNFRSVGVWPGQARDTRVVLRARACIHTRQSAC